MVVLGTGRFTTPPQPNPTPGWKGSKKQSQSENRCGYPPSEFFTCFFSLGGV